MSKDAVMNEAKQLAGTISDYWSEPSVEEIEHWLAQFDKSVRLPLISELRYTLSKSYFSAERAREFLKDLISNTGARRKQPNGILEGSQLLLLPAGRQ